MARVSKRFAFALVAAGVCGFGAKLWLGRSHASASTPPTTGPVVQRSADDPTVNGSEPAAERGSRVQPVELREEIQRLVDRDYDRFQDTRLRELIRRLPANRRHELPELLWLFRGIEWVQRSIIEGWVAVDASGAVAFLESQSTALLRRWEGTLIRVWARTDPEAAAHWLESQPLHANQAGTRVALIDALSETDPTHALKTLRETGWVHTEPNASLHLLRNWAARDLMAGWNALREIEGELTGSPIMATPGSPFSRLSAAFFDGARSQSTERLKEFLRWLPEEVLLKTKDAISRSLLQPFPDLVRGMANEWSTSDAGRSMLHAWASVSPFEALRSLDVIPDSDVRKQVETKALQSGELWASDGISEFGESEAALALIERAVARGAPELPPAMQAMVMDRAAMYAPKLAARLWNSLGVEQQAASAPGFFTNLGRTDLESARSLFGSLPSGAVREAALPRFCFALAAREPTEALDLALAENDLSLRSEAAALVFSTWAAHDTIAAGDALRRVAPQLDLEGVSSRMESAGEVKSRVGSMSLTLGFDSHALRPLLDELRSAPASSNRH
jgi:hypothetical protein